jgi:hypothetical protein
MRAVATADLLRRTICSKHRKSSTDFAWWVAYLRPCPRPDPAYRVRVKPSPAWAVPDSVAVKIASN